MSDETCTELTCPAHGELNRLREQGRRLASRREDLIAAGVDPIELLIPLHPDDV